MLSCVQLKAKSEEIDGRTVEVQSANFPATISFGHQKTLSVAYVQGCFKSSLYGLEPLAGWASCGVMMITLFSAVILLRLFCECGCL
jgi:hypothetical protein